MPVSPLLPSHCPAVAVFACCCRLCGVRGFVGFRVFWGLEGCVCERERHTHTCFTCVSLLFPVWILFVVWHSSHCLSGFLWFDLESCCSTPFVCVKVFLFVLFVSVCVSISLSLLWSTPHCAVCVCKCVHVFTHCIRIHCITFTPLHSDCVFAKLFFFSFPVFFLISRFLPRAVH